MQFKLVLILLYFMVTFVQILYGRICSCTSCFDDVTIPASKEDRIYNSDLCPAGTAAAVSDIKVQSTDGSGFQVYTKDDPSSSTYYVAGSTTSTVTCFNMGSGFLVGGQQSRIYVIITCEEWFQSCSVEYNIDIVCTQIGTTATPKTTSISTATSTNPSTLTTIVFDNTCECQCCKGSAVCNPVYVGIISYGTRICEASDCAKQCAKQFSDCPVDATEPGKIVTQCRNNAVIMQKSSFFGPLLVAISIYIFNIM